MEFLNKNATIVFSKLINAMKGEQHLKISNEPYMPLTIELLGTEISTPWGTAKTYSLCHYHEQCGDLMQDPEMCFFVVDNTNGFTSDWDKMVIAPFLFQQANAGVYEESVRSEKNKLTTFHRKLQADHTAFANLWLRNIQQQGFLKQANQL